MTHPDTAAHTPLNELPTGLDIRLIAMDMDGTLLDDDKNFPEGLWDVWDACRARGITLVPASGRQAWTLAEMFSVVGDDLTIIAENGAFVRSFRPCASEVRTALTWVWWSAANAQPTWSEPTQLLWTPLPCTT